MSEEGDEVIKRISRLRCRGLGQHSINCTVTQPKLALPNGTFKAYLFDCDGTIVDSMPLHYIAWSKALAEWNCPFTEDRFYLWGGMPIVEIIERLSSEYGIAMPVKQVAARKEELYYEHLPNLSAVPEVLEHIERQHGSIPFAVVSGSARESVQASLGATGLLEKFETLVCAGDYVKSKPNPEPFLLAAERLGVPPESCLVFEDAEIGIDAAKAAGMGWVRVPAPWQRQSAMKMTT
jgi:HAD superfamily hydrolase (TIGR01509 family)